MFTGKNLLCALLEFTVMEVVAVFLAVAAVSLLVHDGTTNWFEASSSSPST